MYSWYSGRALWSRQMQHTHTHAVSLPMYPTYEVSSIARHSTTHMPSIRSFVMVFQTLSLFIYAQIEKERDRERESNSTELPSVVFNSSVSCFSNTTLSFLVFCLQIKLSLYLNTYLQYFPQQTILLYLI